MRSGGTLLLLIQWRGALVRPLSMVIGAAITAGAIAAIITLLLPKTWEASTTLLIGRSATGSPPGYDDLLASQMLAQTYSELATTGPILSAVATDLHLNQTPQQLAGSMIVQAPGVNPTVQVTVRGPDPERVAAIANEVAQQLIAWKPGGASTDNQSLAELNQTLTNINAQIKQAQGEADQLQAQGTNATPGALQASLSRLASLLSTRVSLLQEIGNTSSYSVLVIEPAYRPTEPVQPSIVLNVAAAALLGALLAAGVLSAAPTKLGLPGRPSAGG